MLLTCSSKLSLCQSYSVVRTTAAFRTVLFVSSESQPAPSEGGALCRLCVNNRRELQALTDFMLPWLHSREHHNPHTHTQTVTHKHLPHPGCSGRHQFWLLNGWSFQHELTAKGGIKIAVPAHYLLHHTSSVDELWDSQCRTQFGFIGVFHCSSKHLRKPTDISEL